MIRQLYTGIVTLSLMSFPCISLAEWKIQPEGSHIAYGSIKKNSVGEVNSFTTVSGSLSDAGALEVSIDLPSLETWIDIRNERMQEFVFQGAKAATVSGQIDMGALSTLAVGETASADLTATVKIVNAEFPVEAEILVARLAEDRVMAVTNDMLFVSLADTPLNAGIDKLQEVAKLDSITRTIPVTARLMFTTASDSAAAAPAATAEASPQVALAGDADAGKKVFRKCRACHKLDAGRNGAGPTLHGVFGATAGEVDGFKFSKSFQDADFTWTAETMAQFLADPKAMVPGNRMAFNGLKKDEDIQNLIAYLMQETQ